MAEALINPALSLMLECPICQEEFTRPRALPCQHTFCHKCLQKIVQHQGDSNSLCCPVCRAICNLSPQGIAGLPSSIFATNLIDIVHKGGHHKQTTAGGTTAGTDSSGDGQHGDQTQPLPSCPQYEQITPLGVSELDSHRAELSDALLRTEQSLETIRSAIHLTQQQTADVKSDGETLKHQTSAAYRAIHEYLQQEEAKDLSNIDYYCHHTEKVIAATLDQQLSLEAASESIKRRGEQIQNGPDYDLINSFRSVIQRSEEEGNKTVPEIKLWTDVMWSDVKLDRGVEGVRFVKEGGDSDVVIDPQVTAATGQTVTDSDHHIRNLTSFSTTYYGVVTGMVAYHNHLFVVHDYHKMLYSFDERGELYEGIKVCCEKDRKMKDPRGMCLVEGETGEYNLVITDHDSRCLWWVPVWKQASRVKLGKPQRQKVDYCPQTVSTDRSGRAVVSDSYNKYIYIYIQPGPYTSRVQMPKDVIPRQALTDTTGGYVVINGYGGELVWVTSNGEVTRRYTDNESVAARFMVDDGDQLLVVDRNLPCVHKINYDGGHDGHVTNSDRAVKEPRRMCLDAQRCRMWIAHKNKETRDTQIMEMSYAPRLSSVTNLTLSVTLPRLK